jgi:hypothetical protein
MVVAVKKVKRLFLEHEQDRVEKLIVLAQIKDVDPAHGGVSNNGIRAILLSKYRSFQILLPDICNNGIRAILLSKYRSFQILLPDMCDNGSRAISGRSGRCLPKVQGPLGLGFL